jgi:small conductance mechanosensitive channel
LNSHECSGDTHSTIMIGPPLLCERGAVGQRVEGDRRSYPAAPVVELTVSAKVNPSDAAAVKQRVLDHASALLAAA